MKKNNLWDLLGKAVKFRVERRIVRGFVTSIEADVANIRGIDQEKRIRPQFHVYVGELKELTQKEAIELGRELEAGHL